MRAPETQPGTPGPTAPGPAARPRSPDAPAPGDPSVAAPVHALDGPRHGGRGPADRHAPGTAADDAPVLALAVALDEDPLFVSRTVRAFIRDGRLVSIPARERKRRVILRWLRDRLFPDDADVDEAEANARIATVHPDVAALRRYLVDTALLARSGGRYRREPD